MRWMGKVGIFMSKLLDQLFNHSEANVFGGNDYFDEHNGKVASSQANVFGGVDYFDENNQKIGESHENVLGGMDVYEEGSLVVRSIDMPHGTLLTGEDGDVLGSLHDNLGESYFEDVHGHLNAWQNNFLDGYSVNPNTARMNIVFPSLL